MSGCNAIYPWAFKKSGFLQQAKSGLLQIWLAANLACCKSGLLQIWLAANLACCKSGLLQIWLIANLAYCKILTYCCPL
jgi:hypothetical protein